MVVVISFHPFGLVAAAGLVSCALAGNALASSCRIPIYVSMRIPQGSICWHHEGLGNNFHGRLIAGQHVTAKARELIDPKSGGAANAEAWGLAVSGPHDFIKSSDVELDFVVPETGEYNFATSPCAIWGGKGTVDICAR